MSAIPSRTRSLRKPSEAGSRYGRSNTAETIESTAARPERSSQSPSRLPVKPPTRTTRSISTISRPPSATGSIQSNASMRPPAPRANISKPTTTAGLQRSTSNRRSNPPAATETEPVKKDRSKPPMVTSRHLRNASTSSFSTSSASSSSIASGHTRTKSSSTLLNSSIALPASKRNSVEIPKLQAPYADPQLRKQAFSTYQQHFSPAKNLAPKPHPAAFLAPPSPSKLPSNIAISAETAKLQNELLQLHLLHRDAAQVEKEWRASAKQKLGARFHSIVDKNEELVQLDIQETGKINAVALKKWQDQGTPGWGLEEKIQVLDEVVTGVWNLGETGGKYARVVRRFERWMRRCQDVLERRGNDEGLDGDEVAFLEELDKAWKDECLALGRKLEIWREQLRELGSPETGSSLGLVVRGYTSLVRGMLAELSAMAQIERDAMRMEGEWIRSMNDDVMDDDKDTPVAGAIWRSR